jgi:ribose transport system permease protein
MNERIEGGQATMTATTREIARPAADSRAARAARYLLRRYATVLLLVVLMAVFSLSNDRFLTTQNLTNVLVTQAVIGCLALAALLPLIIGEFDLSLGYMVGFLAMLGAWLAGRTDVAILMILAVLVVSILTGLFNGVLTVTFKISSFIATLGVGILLNGGTLGLSNGEVLFNGVPQVVKTVGTHRFAGVTLAVWLVLVLAAILYYVLEHTPLGRRWYAIGGSERVAYLAGVRTGRLKILAFAISGLLVGIGGLVQLGSTGSASPSFGVDLLLPAYAAAFLGVTTYRPGYYNVPGTLVAILVLAIGFNGLSLIGVPFWVQPLFNGAVLLVAVLSARAGGGRRRRAAARAAASE